MINIFARNKPECLLQITAVKSFYEIRPWGDAFFDAEIDGEGDDSHHDAQQGQVSTL